MLDRMPPNIFHSLFKYHPREHHTPKENFLTQAFAYTLRAHPDACRAWLSDLTGESLDALQGHPNVETQAIFAAPNGKTSIIDLVVSCSLADGSEVMILSEHKWDSPADSAQLERYCEIADALPRAAVIFIAPTMTQVDTVRSGTSKVKALHWHEIHDFFQKDSSDGVRAFVEFLVLQGLGPASLRTHHSTYAQRTTRCSGPGPVWNWPTGTTAFSSASCSTMTSICSPSSPSGAATGPAKGGRGRSRRARCGAPT